MGNKYYVENPKKFILEFLDDQFDKDLKLEKKLDKLLDFSFSEISCPLKYHNQSYREDGDCTNLAYSIYWCLWEDKLKDYAEFKEILYGKKFSGDTICTWKTLFNDSRIFLLLDFSGVQLDQIKRFFKLFQSIGNFYLLPSNTVRFSSKNVSLNLYRGDFNGMKDYFDTFRDALIENNDNTIKSLIDENNFFFGSENPWKKLEETFDLQATEKLQFEKHFNYSDFILNQRDYKKHILEYTEKSINMIEERSKIIVEKLKESLTEKI
nr:hypothetical protein [uncultured Treponema sp.]